MEGRAADADGGSDPRRDGAGDEGGGRRGGTGRRMAISAGGIAIGCGGEPVKPEGDWGGAEGGGGRSRAVSAAVDPPAIETGDDGVEGGFMV